MHALQPVNKALCLRPDNDEAEAMKLPVIPNNGGGSLTISRADGVLGGAIWPAASALCQYLLTMTTSTRSTPAAISSVRHCVELGSGTGAVGLYAAALGLPVTLTEHRIPLISAMTSLPYSVDGSLEVDEFFGANARRSNRLLDLLQNNVDRNMSFFKHTPKVKELDWNNVEHAKQIVSSSPVDLILASDVTYSLQLHEALAATISCLLANTNNDSNDNDESEEFQAKCIVSHEERLVNLRGNEDLQLTSFQQALIKEGLTITASHPFPVVSNGGGKPHKVSILEIQRDKDGRHNSNTPSIVWTP